MSNELCLCLENFLSLILIVGVYNVNETLPSSHR